MTTNTLKTAALLGLLSAVLLIGGQALPDFGVAAGALELVLAAAATDVATGAMGRSIEFGVGLG